MAQHSRSEPLKGLCCLKLLLLLLLGAAVVRPCSSMAMVVGQPPENGGVVPAVMRRSSSPSQARLQLALTEETEFKRKNATTTSTLVALGQQVTTYTATKVNVMPHVDRLWTQGLEFASDGRLIETSGNYPVGVGSAVRILDPHTGQPLLKVTDGLKDPIEGTDLFIEGLSEREGRFFATTYEDHKVLEFTNQLEFVRSYDFDQVGWGFARSQDRSSFLATNGSQHILTLDPKTFAVTSTKPVTCMGTEISGLNELEMVDDFAGTGPALLGNILPTRLVLVLNPSSFECRGIFHLQHLEPATPDEMLGYHVANGIAYKRASNTFVVTGKTWDNMYEVSLEKDASEQPEALLMLHSLLELH